MRLFSLLKKHSAISTFALVAIALWGCVQLGWLSAYFEYLAVAICINVILAAGLNLVNGYMGEFSVGHAGFVAIGASVASLLSINMPDGLDFFALDLIAAGLIAACAGAIIAVLSFRTRGDYMAILTLAFLMIVKSALENTNIVNGARGLSGIPKLTTLSIALACCVIVLLVLRNLVYSRYGRHIATIREDELAAETLGIDTRRTKLVAFCFSAFFTGVGGALYAHALEYINPKMFDLAKSTSILVMVYLGGVGSLAGSIAGGTLYTLLLEALRSFGMWRMDVMPFLLIVLIIYRPKGIFGFQEWRILKPASEKT